MSVSIKLAKRLLSKSYVSEFIEICAHTDISPEDYLFEIGMAETVAREYSKDLDSVRNDVSSLEKQVLGYEERMGKLRQRYADLNDEMKCVSDRISVVGITPKYYLQEIERKKKIEKETAKIQKDAKVYEAEGGEILAHLKEKAEKELRPMEALGEEITSYREKLIECASNTYSWETYEKYIFQKQPEIQKASAGSLDTGQYGTEILGASVLAQKFGFTQAISQELRKDSLDYLTEMEKHLEYSESMANRKTEDGSLVWKIKFDSWLQGRMKQMNQEFAEFMQYLQAKKSGK